MSFAYYKTFDKDAIADGDRFEDSWTPDENLVIKRILIRNKDGSALTKSTFYFKISETVFTHEIVPAAILGPDKFLAPVLDIPIKAGQKYSFTFLNQEGVAIDIFISLEIHRP